MADTRRKWFAERRRRLGVDSAYVIARLAVATCAAFFVHQEWIVPFIGAVLVFAVIQVMRHARDLDGFDSQRPGRRDLQPTLKRRIPTISRAELIVIATAITSPHLVIARIKENVHVLTRALDIETNYWLSFEVSGATETVRFPLLIPNKGELLDSFRVTLSDGSELPTVTFEESIGLAVACIDRLAKSSGSVAYAKYLAEVRDELIAAIASRGKNATKAQHEYTLGRMTGILGSQPPATMARIIAQQLIRKYAIFVTLPTGPSTKEPSKHVEVVVHTKRRSVQVREGVSRISVLRRVVRDIAGVRDNTFGHSLQQADRTPSYHLEFLGPQGTYLAKQRLSPDTKPRPYRYLNFRHRLGQRYAHMYLRGGQPGLRTATARFTFHERPPGSIGTATIAALANLVGIYATSRVALVDGENGGKADAVALLVALPGLASGVLEFGRPAGMIGGVFVARLTSSVTFLLSCVAILLFYVERIPAWTHLDFISYRDAWTITLTISAVTWAMAASSWLRRSRLYTYVLTHDPEAGSRRRLRRLGKGGAGKKVKK